MFVYERTADSYHDCLPLGRPAASQAAPFAAILRFEFDFPWERSLCSHSPSTCVASIRHCFLLFFFSLPPPPTTWICSHWVARRKKKIKKSPPPTKRTKTWRASEEERPLPLKFRNKKNDLFFWACCSLMWHCDQYQMLDGKDFCQAFPAKIDLTYQLLFVGLTMCVTIKGCCHCIVNTWIVPVLCIYYCELQISRKECLALAIDTGPVLQRELNQPSVISQCGGTVRI